MLADRLGELRTIALSPQGFHAIALIITSTQLPFLIFGDSMYKHAFVLITVLCTLAQVSAADGVKHDNHTIRFDQDILELNSNQLANLRFFLISAKGDVWNQIKRMASKDEYSRKYHQFLLFSGRTLQDHSVIDRLIDSIAYRDFNLIGFRISLDMYVHHETLTAMGWNSVHGIIEYYGKSSLNLAERKTPVEHLLAASVIRIICKGDDLDIALKILTSKKEKAKNKEREANLTLLETYIREFEAKQMEHGKELYEFPPR